MEKIRTHKDLKVFQLSFEAGMMILDISKTFPKEEMYSLTDQIRRASRSIGGQIAEAWGKRRYQRHFISKLTDADGEQLEAQHWIETALDCKYLQEEKAEYLLQKCFTIGKMLSSMIDKASSFCRKAPI